MEIIERPFVIAGPCSVESREQLESVCTSLCSLPQVQMIRGGVWKPRTRPGGFEGLGEPALQWMQEISNGPLRMADGNHVRFCCEVARPEHIELCLRHGINTVWIGARTTGNPFMVDELAEALRGNNMQVMVKNPMSPDVRLWIGAFERLQQANINCIAAIHRGFNMYNNYDYRNTPLWELAIELRRTFPTLPILCDPSHISGKSSMAKDLMLRALQLAYDGFMVEVHPNPSQAWTDADQQLTPSQLSDILKSLPTNINDDSSHTTALEALRSRIDAIDYDMLQLLARRMEVSREIAAVKRNEGISVYQAKRWESVMNNRIKIATDMGLDPKFVKELLDKIHIESVRVQFE